MELEELEELDEEEELLEDATIVAVPIQLPHISSTPMAVPERLHMVL